MNSKYRLIKYNGELDNVDPFDYGVKLCKEGKSYTDDENDPTENFIGGSDDDPVWSFLWEFRDKMEKGWHSEAKRLRKVRYLEQLPAFQESLPEVGQVVYMEYPNNEGSNIKVKIEFIPPERHMVLVRYLDGRDVFGQPRLSVVSYEHPGRFVRFYKEPPAIQNESIE